MTTKWLISRAIERWDSIAVEWNGFSDVSVNRNHSLESGFPRPTAPGQRIGAWIRARRVRSGFVVRSMTLPKVELFDLSALARQDELLSQPEVPRRQVAEAL